MSDALDATDLHLIDALRTDGRSSYAQLGRLVGLSGPGVQDRLRRLEEREVLSGYRAEVNLKAVGLGVSALVGVYLSDSANQDVVDSHLAACVAIEHCWFVAGDESFVVVVRCADVDELEKTIWQVRGIEGVSRTKTNVVLSTRWENRPVPLPAATDD
ncbi:MAG: AsnC family transcriptional regulator [Streptosporangiales bacterium]|nr:AsnC family transcriptional regulator [Streptosporangiales bacterium]